MLSNEIFANENGLKNRVTACRKRLRLNRTHRPHVDNQPEELFQEMAMGLSEFRDYSGDPSAMEDSLAEGIHPRDGEMAQRLDGQEVGIT